MFEFSTKGKPSESNSNSAVCVGTCEYLNSAWFEMAVGEVWFQQFVFMTKTLTTTAATTTTTTTTATAATNTTNNCYLL